MLEEKLNTSLKDGQNATSTTVKQVTNALTFKDDSQVSIIPVLSCADVGGKKHLQSVILCLRDWKVIQCPASVKDSTCGEGEILIQPFKKL